MRIVIDLQGAQTESRFRGIGRYALALAKAIVRHRGEHEVLIALNGLFSATIAPIRAEFRDILPRENIRVWHGVGPTRECNPANASNRNISEYLREAAILRMRPDVVLLTSLFEGFGDEAIVSVGLLDTYTPTVSVLYDLIPLIAPDEDFRKNPIHIGYYRRKLDSLKRCSALLAISESARAEAIHALGFREERVSNISSGCDMRFTPQSMSNEDFSALCAKFKITRPFVMYTGGADERKNLPRLIQAFAALPKELRCQLQLLLVGKMPPLHINLLEYEVKRAGLNGDDIIFTGFVSDLELMQLYTACRVFVFPSLHEGFGLPPLEAMACGAPVIVANATSLPEVVGRDDVLFNPLSVSEISQRMQEVLCNENFRCELIEYGLGRAAQFSWDQCALKAITVMSELAIPSIVAISDEPVAEIHSAIFKPRPLRILVSKLDHMGDLVLATPALLRLKARYPNACIDALVGSWNVAAASHLGIFSKVYSLDFFGKKSSVSAGVPQKLDELIRDLPQYDIAIDLRRPGDTRFILAKVPAKLRVGFSSGNNSIDAKLHICLPATADEAFVVTDFNRESTSLQMLGLIDALPYNPNDYVSIPAALHKKNSGRSDVAIFPNAGNPVKEWGTENFKALIRLLDSDVRIHRIGIFVGSADEVVPFINLTSTKLMLYSGLNYEVLRSELSSYEVCVANNSYGAHLASLLGLSVVGIYGGHETPTEWGPVFGDARVLYIPLPCAPCHIPEASACVRNFDCLKLITPERVLRSVLEALNCVDHLSIQDIRSALVKCIASEIGRRSDTEIMRIAQGMSQDLSLRNHKRLFIDVSELAIRDARTGIQRVVRSILDECLKLNFGYEAVPVYATADQLGYRVASKFLNRQKYQLNDGVSDSQIDYQAGDLFLGLDFQPTVVCFQRPFFSRMRAAGVGVSFVVYDLLCLNMPQFFDLGLPPAFTEWLRVVSEQDGAICISKATANELAVWLKSNSDQNGNRLAVSWFHLGADIAKSMPSLGMPEDSDLVLEQIRNFTSFLMVGTLEPRKGYEEALETFDTLWASNEQVCLILVGKQGWMVDTLVERIRNHPEYGKRLIWLDEVSDEYLEFIYANADCLLAASRGEGFGLPLIEAAQHGLPIVARDLAVFREVAGDHAYYFSDIGANGFSEEIKCWLQLFQRKSHPTSDGLKFLTWADSTRQLLNCVLAIEESLSKP